MPLIKVASLVCESATGLNLSISLKDFFSVSSLLENVAFMYPDDRSRGSYLNTTGFAKILVTKWNVITEIGTSKPKPANC
jgi:hypothetical protein